MSGDHDVPLVAYAICAIIFVAFWGTIAYLIYEKATGG